LEEEGGRRVKLKVAGFFPLTPAPCWLGLFIPSLVGRAELWQIRENFDAA
jgi:hypothetical protein